MTRQRFKLFIFAAAIVAAALTAQAAMAAPKKTDVSILFEYAVNGRHAAFFVAKDKGYYKQAGLNVELDPGRGQGITLNTVAAGKADFGIGDSLLLTQAAETNMGVKAISVLEEKDPAGFAFWANENVKTMKDFEGKKISHATGGGFKDLLRITMELNGADYSKVQIEDVSPAVVQTLFLNHQVDGASNTYEFYAYLEANAGPGKTNFIMLANYGLKIYGYFIYATSKTLQDDPDMVRAFVGATVKGMNYTMQHPNEAAAILVKNDPNLDLGMAQTQVARWVELNNKAERVGYFDPVLVKETITTVTKALNLKSTIKPEDLYSGAFLP